MTALEAMKDRFSGSLDKKEREYSDIFSLLKTASKNSLVLLTGVDPAGMLSSGSAEAEDAPSPPSLGDACIHAENSRKPVVALPAELKGLMQDISRVKRLLKRHIGNSPDLSGFYKLVREELHRRDDGEQRGPLLFGDIIDDIVQAVYGLQPIGKYPIISQFMYLAALADEVFAEVPDEPPEPQPVHIRRITPKGRRESRDSWQMRLLKKDFLMLAMRQVTSDYGSVALGLLEKGGRSTSEDRGTIPAQPDSDADVRSRVKFDVSATYTISKYLERLIAKTGRPELLQRGLSTDGTVDILELGSWLHNFYFARLEASLGFSAQNIHSIEKLEAENWQDLRFSREVPPVEKLFFEEGKEPLILRVDPAPGKTYVSAVGIICERNFDMLKRKYGDLETARDFTNVLRKPVARRHILPATTLSFYVRRSDGELCVYGDSNSLARRLLGAHYEICKKMVHHALWALVHSGYKRGSDSDGQPPGPARMPSASSPSIPDEPFLREIPAPPRGAGESEKAFKYRVAHTRLLPPGWYPSIRGWKKIRESGLLDLYALVSKSGSSKDPGFEYVKLDLSISEYEKFRETMRELAKKYQGRVRFQTYVSESGSRPE